VIDLKERAMLFRIVATGACILGLMIAVKDGRVLRATGLTGTCAVAQTATDGSQLDACRPGKLDGRPDLSKQGCTDAGTSGTYEYWRCPAEAHPAYTP
jgi:hypothetical protein